MSHRPIDPLHVRALADGRHFTADGLRRAFAADLGTERLRAVVHFGRMRCQVCWRLLDELASLKAPPLPAEVSPTLDPVLAALRRLVTAYREPATIDRLRPVHGFWLGRCRHDELGFFRLTVEESRQHRFEHSASGLDVARGTLDLLERLPFEDLGLPWIDLKARARAYLGDAHRAAGQRRPAVRQLATARQELSRGTGDPELGATWHELRARLAQSGGQYTVALDLLDEAMELVREVEVEGRDAETLVLLGLVRLRSGDDHGAVDAFRQALRAIPPGKFQRLRLRAFQALALVEVRRRHFAEAGEHLATARALEAKHSSPWLRSERLWIEGILHFEAGRYGEAEDPLRSSMELFQRLGRIRDAALVLSNLARVYIASGRMHDLAGLERELRTLLQASASRKWVLALRERIVRWAEKEGFTLPPSSEVKAELDGDRQTWIG